MQLTPFRVTMTDDTTHDLTIMPADRMRAERASTAELPPSQRSADARKAHAETWMLLWLWCVAKRHGLTSLGFEPWADTVADYARLDADGELVDDDTPDEDVERVAVDPTRQAGPTS